MSLPYQNYVQAASSKYGVPVNLINSVIKQESGFKANVTSGAGAQGLMQLMPSTAKSLGVSNAYDPQQNIDGGTKYLAQLLKQFKGNTTYAVAAYNAGPGAVLKYGGIPPYSETRNYVNSVMSMYNGGNIDVSGLNASSSNSSSTSIPGLTQTAFGLPNVPDLVSKVLGIIIGAGIVFLGIWVAMNPLSDLSTAIISAAKQFSKMPLEGATKAVKNAPGAVRQKSEAATAKRKENRSIRKQEKELDKHIKRLEKNGEV